MPISLISSSVSTVQYSKQYSILQLFCYRIFRKGNFLINIPVAAQRTLLAEVAVAAFDVVVDGFVAAVPVAVVRKTVPIRSFDNSQPYWWDWSRTLGVDQRERERAPPEAVVRKTSSSFAGEIAAAVIAIVVVAVAAVRKKQTLAAIVVVVAAVALELVPAVRKMILAGVVVAMPVAAVHTLLLLLLLQVVGKIAIDAKVAETTQRIPARRKATTAKIVATAAAAAEEEVLQHFHPTNNCCTAVVAVVVRIRAPERVPEQRRN